MLECYRKEVERLSSGIGKRIPPTQKELMEEDMDIFIGYLILYFKEKKRKSHSIKYTIKTNGRVKLDFWTSPDPVNNYFANLVEKWVFPREIKFIEALSKRLSMVSIEFDNEMNDPSYMAMPVTCSKFKATFFI